MYKKIRDALATLPELTNADGQVQIYPVVFDTADVVPPLCVYAIKGPEPFRALSGKLHHNRLVFTADLLSDDYDLLFDMADCAETAIVRQTYPGLLTLSVDTPDDDAYAPDVDLYRKRLTVEIAWKEASDAGN